MCQNGSCISQNTGCTTNTDCQSGQVCQNGSCVNSSSAIPSAPTNLTATAGNAQVSLTWSASIEATSYNVYIATTTGGPYSTGGTTTTTGYTVTGLTNGTPYYFTVIAVNSAGMSGSSNQASATPFLGLSGWSYKRTITINNTSNATTLTNYQISFTMDTQSLISTGKMLSDGGDIRIFDSDNTTSLNYWIESGINTTVTTIWVKAPSITANSTKTIYLYYGNASATSQSNGDSTFLFFDDFTGTTLDTNKWTLFIHDPGASYDITSSVLHFYDPNNNDYDILITSTTTFSSATKIIALQKKNGYGSTDITFLGSSSSGEGYRWDTNDCPGGYWSYDGSTGCGVAVGGNYFDNIFHRVILIQTLSAVFVTVDGVALGGLAHTLTPPYKIILQNWTPSWKSGDGNSYWDYIAVANYTSPDPVVTVGIEQNN